MRLCINPAPTFDADVPLSMPGGQVATLRFKFRHKTRPQLEAWLTSFTAESLDHERLSEVIEDWPGGPVDAAGKPVAYSLEALAQLCTDHPGVGIAIHQTYLRELTDNRAKNSGR
jgi:hypothetical protein